MSTAIGIVAAIGIALTLLGLTRVCAVSLADLTRKFDNALINI